MLLKYRNVFIHIAGWLFIIFINIMDIEKMEIRSYMLMMQVSMWIVYIVLFYLNFSLLIPKLLLRRRTTIYVCSIVFLFFGSFFLIRYSHQLIKQDEITSVITKLESGRDIELSEKRMIGGAATIEKARIVKSELFSLNQFNPLNHRSLPLVYGLLLVITIGMIARFMERWKGEERRRIEMDKEHVTSELEYLKQQINPHFLFNALNSIYSLTLPCSQTASDSILKLSSILRYMLYSTTNKEVFLEDEIAIIKDYMGLQELRLTKKTKVKFITNGDFGGIKIEPLLLIPIIENAFKYGVNASKESFIEVNISIKNKKFIFETRNTVVVDERPKDSGLGLKNIKRRTDLIYPGAHTLTAEQQGDLFVVRLEINF